MKSNSTSFDKIWRNLQKQENIQEFISSHLKERRPFLDFIIKYVNKLAHEGEKVNILEAGCGTAIDSCYLARNTHSYLWAIDISPEAIKFAKKIGRFLDCPIKLKVDDINKTSFESNFFDLIFSQGTMEHFPYPLVAIREQVRILKPGGYLIISVPQRYNIYTLFKFTLKVLKKWPYGWERSYTMSELHKLGKEAGLRVVDTCSWGMESELSRSKRAYLKAIGQLYNISIKIFYRFFSKCSVHFLQDICAVYTNDIERNCNT